MRIAYALPCLALLAAGCADPLFFAEVEEKQVCLTLTGQAIDGPPAGTVFPEMTGIWSGSYDLGGQVPGLDQNGVTGTIRLDSFTITVASGGADLSGVRDARIIASAAGIPDATLLQIDPARSDATHLVLTGGAGTNLFDYLSSGTLAYRVEIAGTPPTGSWVADMQACMYAKLGVDALKAMQK